MRTCGTDCTTVFLETESSVRFGAVVGHKIQNNGVHAVAFAGWWRPVIKDVTEMGIAASTKYLGSLHSVGVVRLKLYAV